MEAFFADIAVKEVAGSINPELVAGFIEKVLDQNNLTVNKLNLRNAGIFFGRTFNNFSIRDNFLKNYLNRGIRAVNPVEFPKTLLSYLGSYLAIKFGLQGVNCTFSSGCSSGLDALLAGIYFLERNENNQALIVELAEKMSRKPEEKAEIICILLKNIGSQRKDEGYGTVLALESFFEKAGQNKGLLRAVEKALSSFSLGNTQIDCIVNSRIPESKDYLLEQKVAENFFQSQKISLSLNPEKNVYYSGLSSLAWILTNGDIYEKINKNNSVTMFLNLGCDSNSSCLIFKNHNKNES